MSVATGAITAEELRQALEETLLEVDTDPEAGPKLRASDVAFRLECPDVGMVLNVAAERDDPDHCLRWDFSDQVDWKPSLEMIMDSEVANSYLQGAENFAIAIARGRIKASCEASAALRAIPAKRPLLDRYKKLVEAKHPDLAV